MQSCLIMLLLSDVCALRIESGLFVRWQDSWTSGYSKEIPGARNLCAMTIEHKKLPASILVSWDLESNYIIILTADNIFNWCSDYYSSVSFNTLSFWRPLRCVLFPILVCVIIAILNLLSTHDVISHHVVAVCYSSDLSQHLWTLFQVFMGVKWVRSAEIMSALI